MDRPRSKRSSSYYSPSPPPRSRARLSRHPHRRSSGDRRPFPPPSSGGSAVFSGGPPTGAQVTTSYRILCPESRLDETLDAIEEVQSQTRAWVSVHRPSIGDSERIIETADSAVREPDGRPPEFSPAQDALIMIHRQIIDSPDEERETSRGGERNSKVTSRLVVPKLHVGCLLGKGGKIIEQMRNETRTHIRVLPRDGNTPRCVAISEEVLQVAGDPSSVKRAIAIISDRLKESQHRDRGGSFRERDRHSFLPDEDFLPPSNPGPPPGDTRFGPGPGPPPGAFLPPPNPGPPPGDDRFFLPANQGPPPGDDRFGPGPDRFGPGEERFGPGPANPGALPGDERFFDGPARFGELSGNSGNGNSGNSGNSEVMVFRILCPSYKVEKVAKNGVFEMLRGEVGVEIRVCENVSGSNETVILISSKEGPDDELFPAQEALLHIQSQIVDLGPDKDNVINTRLLVPSKEIMCFNSSPDDLFSEIKKSCFANVQILPKEDRPVCASDSDELIQIVGEIRAARNALVQVTEKLRSFIYSEFYYNDNVSPKELHYPQKIAAPGPWNNPKDVGPSASGSFEQEASNISENIKRYGVPIVARSTLEVIIPNGLVEILAMRSRNKLAQISEISGATVNLVEETDEVRERVVRISGSKEQADKAQSLLQGFILSIQDDLPSN